VKVFFDTSPEPRFSDFFTPKPLKMEPTLIQNLSKTNADGFLEKHLQNILIFSFINFLEKFNIPKTL